MKVSVCDTWKNENEEVDSEEEDIRGRGQGKRIRGKRLWRRVDYLLIRIPIEFLVTNPRQHLRKYLPRKYWISNIHNFPRNFLILPTLVIVPFSLQHDKPGSWEIEQRGKDKRHKRLEETRRWGKGQYFQWDDVVLPWPEHTTSVDGVRNLNLKAAIVNSTNEVLVHTENNLLGTNISKLLKEITKKSMPAPCFLHDLWPSEA